jgi:hypothetical protein
MIQNLPCSCKGSYPETLYITYPVIDEIAFLDVVGSTANIEYRPKD